MRSLCIVALLFVVAAPAFAQQQPHRRECFKLNQQIARYERDLSWAEERGNDLWAQSNATQIQRLSSRRGRLCAGPAGPDATEEFMKLLDVATRVAARWFLGGL